MPLPIWRAFFEYERHAFDDVKASPSLGSLIHSVTVFHGGRQLNSIPDYAYLEGNVRTIPEFDNTAVQNRLQTLVDRFHLPCEYAFMLTTALRFVPNFLADSEITLDAQSCRGYSNRGNCVKRLLSYVVVIRPLVMRAVAKSETLALSMELKGFGSNTYKNMPREPLGAADFIVLGLVVVLSTYPFWK